MQFVVPQFIDVEDKVLGPLSVRQFVILLGGAGLIFLFYKLLSFFNFAIAAVFTLIMVFLFAFIKINGRGFHYFLLSLFQTYRRPQFQIWRKDDERYTLKPEAAPKRRKGEYVAKIKGPLTSSRLAQLTLVVDTGGSYDAEEPEDVQQNPNEKITTLEI